MTYIIKDDNISVLSLSARALNCLNRAKLYTVGALLEFPLDELMDIRNMGKKTAEEIKNLVRSIVDGDGDYILVENKDGCSFNDVKSEISLVNSDGSTTVFIDKNGAVISDILVEDLLLSVRAKNCLSKAGIKYASQLVGLTYDELMNLKNMGNKTANEVLEYLSKISVKQSNGCDLHDEVQYNSHNEMATEMTLYYGELENIWLREIIAVKGQYPEAVGETLIYRLYEKPYVRGVLKAKVLELIEGNGDVISKPILADRLPKHLMNTAILEEIIIELENVFAVSAGEVLIHRQYPSVTDFAEQLKDERVKEVIFGRLEGKTLNEIGEQYGVTRERVRQLMSKGLNGRPRLREDRYVYIYSHYDFSLEDFSLAYGEPKETYNYLEMICSVPRGQRKPLEELLTDSLVLPELRKRAERAIYKKYISVNGVRVKMTRSDLVKHYVKVYCGEATKYETFFKGYNGWLESIGLGEKASLAIEYRTYENKFSTSDFVLWSQWGNFRYYNILEKDYEELLSTLDLEGYENTELSTLKLYRDYPAMMKQYDIHDEYELHNLLKKIWPSQNDNVKFKRMPTIEIGEVDRKEQVFSLLLQYAPIAGDAFASIYEDTYGVKSATVMANYMEPFDVYYHNGIYSVNFKGLPSEQFDRMSEILTSDFYSIAEVKRIFSREFPKSRQTDINPYTLKTLGFMVYSGYVVSNRYSSAVEFFRELLTKDDVVDARTFDRSMLNVVAYSSELYHLKEKREIIEFLPLQFVNIRRLNAVGVTKDHLEEYCNAVKSFVERGAYFTIQSIRKLGFSHTLDELGFDEWFYASILLEDHDNFSYRRMGGNKVFCRGRKEVTLSALISWLVEQRQKVNIYDLQDLLSDEFNVLVPHDKLLQDIRDTDLYYDAIMETVYTDYDTYFEEI